MAKPKSTKPKKPTIFQAGVLKQIAVAGPLIKTYSAARRDPQWTLKNGQEISTECANALIRHGWVIPQRDGLSLYDESQTYVLKPVQA